MYNPYPYNGFNGLSGAYSAPIKQEIVKVNGENGARAYDMAPNGQALLLDMNNPLVYLVQSDGAGYKTVTAYTITPYTPERPEDTMKILEERIAKLEKRLSDESNTPATKSKS